MKAKTRGYATYKNGKLYFDATGWAMVRKVARLAHRSPKDVIVAALKRGFKREKAKVS